MAWGRSEFSVHMGACVGGDKSTLNAPIQFQLVEGCDEAVVGCLIISQLKVARPDHHYDVKTRLFSCFGLCKGEQQVSE